MTQAGNRGKLYHLFTVSGAIIAFVPDSDRQRGILGGTVMVGLASAMFVALFGWGDRYLGWADPEGKVQLALVTAFVLGAVAGYKSRS